MTKLKLHYDGWLALPAVIRRRLGITTGDQLDTEWTDGGLLLKVKGGGGKATEPERDKAELEPEIVEKAEELQVEPKPAKTARAKRKAQAKPPTRSTSRLTAKILPKARGRKA